MITCRNVALSSSKLPVDPILICINYNASSTVFLLKNVLLCDKFTVVANVSVLYFSFLHCRKINLEIKESRSVLFYM